ncbi:MAG: PspC domain-containing protein [Acidimicrobiales bacterium]
MDTAPDETPGAPATEAHEQLPPSPDAGDPGHPGHPGEQHLHRVGRGRMLAGVAAGVADYLDVDPTIVRIAFVTLAFLGGLAVPLYLAGWLLIPDEGSDVSVAEELMARERASGAY